MILDQTGKATMENKLWEALFAINRAMPNEEGQDRADLVTARNMVWAVMGRHGWGDVSDWKGE